MLDHIFHDTFCKFKHIKKLHEHLDYDHRWLYYVKILLLILFAKRYFNTSLFLIERKNKLRVEGAILSFYNHT